MDLEAGDRQFASGRMVASTAVRSSACRGIRRAADQPHDGRLRASDDRCSHRELARVLPIASRSCCCSALPFRFEQANANTTAHHQRHARRDDQLHPRLIGRSRERLLTNQHPVESSCDCSVEESLMTPTNTTSSGIPKSSRTGRRSRPSFRSSRSAEYRASEIQIVRDHECAVAGPLDVRREAWRVCWRRTWSPSTHPTTPHGNSGGVRKFGLRFESLPLETPPTSFARLRSTVRSGSRWTRAIVHSARR